MLSVAREAAQCAYKCLLSVDVPSLSTVLLHCLRLASWCTGHCKRLPIHALAQASLSLFRGAAALSGLLSTVIFPRLHRATGLPASAGAGIAWLNLCLWAGAAPTIAAAFAGAPLAAPPPAAAAAGVGRDAVGGGSPLLLLLLCGLVGSRLGVWLFDLAVSQMQQELVAPESLGEWCLLLLAASKCRLLLLAASTGLIRGHRADV